MKTVTIAAALAVAATAPTALAGTQSVARQWNELLLESIRHDLSRPTVHARNLFHVSAAMYDVWAAYDDVADQVLINEKATARDIEAARNEAISYAAFRLLDYRFANSPGFALMEPQYIAKMNDLGYDPNFTSTIGPSPAAVGNRCAATIIAFGQNDGSNEQNNYANQFYQPLNPPLIVELPGNPEIIDANRWQPLALEYFIDQSGNPIPFGYPPAVSPEWGEVTPFSLTEDQVSYHYDDYTDYTYKLWLDPGAPPLHGGIGDDEYKWGFAMVAVWSSHLDPDDGVMIDISPATIGGAHSFDGDPHAFYDYFEGGDNGTGHPINPVTGEPYEPEMVLRGDYTRILAEFWADGPASETPPGHWFTILNYVSDHPLLEKRLGGEGPILDDLEWDVKSYLTLGAAMHDTAVTCWSAKGRYDYIRPVSAIRFLADQGQSSDPKQPSYNPDGIPLYPGYIEVVTEETIQPGERHEHLAGKKGENVGKIALYAWRGPDYVPDPEVDYAGVGWILAENWWPYQRPTFVSPPFPGYYSGHSTYSRCAAHILTLLTGDEYFPGGLGEFECPQNEFLVFEDGPTMDITLQWAKYQDASDQTSLSRIWGGIHPPQDDLPGRLNGDILGPQAYGRAIEYFNGTAFCNDADFDCDGTVGPADLASLLANWGACADCPEDLDGDGVVGPADLAMLLANWG
ncbi:MAG: hypothetical protein KDA25_02985 [Phycisphaerales bacterium]|nr:hypothetical protein [Phycisphaerales bacterium]